MTDAPGFPGGPEERTASLELERAVERLRLRDIASRSELFAADAKLVLAVLERSRGLEAALSKAADDLDWAAKEFDRLDRLFTAELAESKALVARASLSAVPEVQDDDVYEARSASPVPAGEGQDVAMARLDAITQRQRLDWGCWSDREKRDPETHYEVRVFGREADEGVRVLERGASLADAVAKVVARLEPKDAVPAAGARRAKADNPDHGSRLAGGTP